MYIRGGIVHYACVTAAVATSPVFKITNISVENRGSTHAHTGRIQDSSNKHDTFNR